MLRIVLSSFLLLHIVVEGVAQPNVNGMAMPPYYQNYLYKSDLSMDPAATWTVSYSASKTSDTVYALANNNFGLASSVNIPTNIFNYRIELDVTASYSSTCEFFGLMLFKSSAEPVLTRVTVNRVTLASGLMLFQSLCQNGALRASFDSGTIAAPTEVPNLGQTLVAPCSKCQLVTSSASAANYKMIIQVVNQRLTVIMHFQ